MFVRAALSRLGTRCKRQAMASRRDYWTPVASPPGRRLSGAEFWLLGGGLFVGLYTLPHMLLLMVPKWARPDDPPPADEE